MISLKGGARGKPLTPNAVVYFSLRLLIATVTGISTVKSTFSAPTNKTTFKRTVSIKALIHISSKGSV